jgi:uncharacterized membrane protein
VLTGALVVAAVLLLGVALLWSQRAEKRREEIPSPLRGG